MEPKLEISPNFTLEDIRKIRDYDYEMTKNMNNEEMIAYYNKGADYFRKELKASKNNKASK
ncbi:MAG: hypothetical protein FWG98_04350 [Candidatus Cloacimonetes bacterium]|nr:hypothetical protein [Candidatus Cloacimonadota bacterium]